ncbi:hypothetical protein, variant 2 [Verruconis gallopava]|nr:hypothetical protein, variant 1 [Verruconis gallopava]XP_016209108.1 hypothetical protein, variant 2 [Verruconis gallopava]KIV99237.1 hypothetical protein, variant 1 [Verruconis gallopava]KIV99238.1 hypothetical protein, variant 2 [Verruconis gallopava]
MRLLPDHQRTAVLDSICTYVQTNTNFQVPDCDLHIQVIPGATEGLYGWVAANYLLGGFDYPQDHDHGKGHHTYGFLDMGGASAQIAFAPNATEAEKHANDLTLLRLRTLDGSPQEHRVFVTTWLGFGANEARRRYVDALKESVGPQAKELPDPCLPTGLKATLAGTPIVPGSPEEAGHEPHLLGTGKFDECIRQTYPLLEKDKPCNDNPCLLGGTHVPAIDFEVNHFVGVSEYWHTTHSIFEMDHDNKAYDFHTYQTRINAFCSQPWEDIVAGVEKHKWGKKVDEKTAEEVCFKASWLINMLHEGIGVPRVGLEMAKGGSGRNETTKQLIEGAKSKGFLDPFQAVDKIEGTEVSWTLGKMVLYAASQIPPSHDDLPVGFGSNIPGVALPKDFQQPGGSSFNLPDDLTDHGFSDETDFPSTVEGEEVDWHEALFRDSPRRIPGFLLFMLILVFLVFLLCGRERRATLISKTRRILGLGKGSPLLGGRLGKYDRVMRDDPEAAGEFELGDGTYDDDSDDEGSVGATSSRAAKVPGWATPTMEGGVGGLASPGKGLGLGIKPFGVQGVVSRTESRERLSRSGSPRAGFRTSKDALD